MGRLTLALLALLPLAEIAGFILVGDALGLWPTLGLVVLAALAGGALLRLQGLATMRRAREALARDELPAEQLFADACVMAAGLLLILPGFVTDLAALPLLLPPVRHALRRALARRLGLRAAVRPRGGVIEGEFAEVRPPEERLEPPRRPGPGPQDAERR